MFKNKVEGFPMLGISFIIGVVFTVYFLYLAINCIYYLNVTWVKNESEIVKCHIEDGPDGESSYSVKYSYEVTGKKYLSDEIYMTEGMESISSRDYYVFEKKFKNNELIDTYYDLNNPSRAICHKDLTDKDKKELMTEFIYVLIFMGPVFYFRKSLQPHFFTRSFRIIFILVAGLLVFFNFVIKDDINFYQLAVAIVLGACAQNMKSLIEKKTCHA